MCHCNRAFWIGVTSLLLISAAAVLSTQANPTPLQARQDIVAHRAAFTKNMGQWPDSILFRADIGEAVMWIVRDGIYYQFSKRIPKTDADSPYSNERPSMPHSGEGRNPDRDSIITDMIKAQFVGANRNVEVTGLEELDYKCNYFLGTDPADWRTDVPNYNAVTFRELYPGVDASFGEREGQLECRLTVSSAADLAQIRIEYHGDRIVTKDTDGIVSIQTAIGEKRFAGILPHEETAPSVATVASTQSPNAGVSLLYSTYLGGATRDEGHGIAVDAGGNTYVTGYTGSANFPTQNPYQTDSADGTDDVFVTKFSPAGNSLLYSTYLGGESSDLGYSIAVDGDGNAYVTGRTNSSDFPTQSPYQTDKGDYDAFVTKLSAAGNSLLYSTYLCGGSLDYGFGIAVDGSGNAYVTGRTDSPDFPTQNPYQTDQLGSDVFLTKLSVAGNNLLYSTYLGGGSYEEGRGIAVDGSGNAYVTGFTVSTNYPTQNPYQTDPDGADADAFVTKLSAAGNSLLYSTYLGGGGSDACYGIAVDVSGNAYVTGYTLSTNFPTQNPYQTDQSDYDAFVTKLSAPGNSLIFSTYLGGGSTEGGYGIALDGSGNAYVTGYTLSTSFPTQSQYQTDQGAGDIFVTEFSATGGSLLYSTYLGGGSSDYGFGIAVNGSGNAYVTGSTTSTNFPTHNPYQADPGDENYDVLVTKLAPPILCCLPDAKLRGDVSTSGGTLPDGDGTTDGSDLGVYVDYVFFADDSSFRLDCSEVSDLNDDASTDGGDLGILVDYIFFNDTSVIVRCDGGPF